MVKGKRWKKGQSSTSNPETKKYRDLAKNSRNFFNFGISSGNETSQLTSKALAQLDSMSISNDNFETKSMISEADSADTFKSWASNWSDCTNATFNKVHRYWRSNSALHKEILAVLAAITEVIKENDGKESETEYLAALMTGLDSIDDNEDSVAAFLYLIALAIKKVPENILKAKYIELLNQFMKQIERYGKEAKNVTLIKSCLMCLCWLLKSQEKKVWELDQTVKSFLTILNFIVHEKPKIRKCGQEAVRLILNSCNSTESTDVYKFVSSLTAEYCLDLIKNRNDSDEDTLDEKKKGKTKNDNEKVKKADLNQRILYTLSLIRNIVHHFDLKHIKSLGECILQLMTLKDLIIISNCYQIFYQLFNSQTNQLNGDLNAQMINAFYDYQPSENDPQQLIAWLAVMESAIKSLNRLNKKLCLSHLPRLSQTFMNTLSVSHHKNVHVVITNCLSSILEQCVQTNIDLLINDLKESSDIKKSILQKIFSHIESGLSYQYHNSWIFVMKILACAFTSFKHRDTFVIVENCLTSLANLRESEQFDYKKEADLAIGRAIQTYGPKLVIDSIDLGITGDEETYEYPRSWMLPLLKQYVEKTELSYFVKKIMPLSKKLRAKSEFFTQNKKPLEAKIFDTLQNQFWSLLPGFCNFPTDFSDSFKNLAKTLGEVLEKCPDLRLPTLQGLRALINRNTDENRILMGKFAKNYLPIMFNIYTTEIRLDKDSNRQCLIDTIRCYLKIADQDLVNTYLLQAIKNYENYSKLHEEALNKSIEVTNDLNNNSTNSNAKTHKVQFDFDKTVTAKSSNNMQTEPYLFAKYSFLDLIAILAKYINSENIQVVYDLAISGIGSKELDKTVQKKSYKILNSIFVSGKKSNKQDSSYKQNEAIFKYVQENFESIASVYVKSLAHCNSAAKVPRLKCLLDLMDYVQNPEQKIFIRQILPEIILSIREVNHKSRDAAFELLNSMLRLWQKLGLKSSTIITETDSLNEFLHLVMVGLAGSANMISCTCLALSSLTHEFRENISGTMIKDLVDTSCLLIRSDNKEVVLASLNLLKIICTIFHQAVLGQYLDQICDAIHNLHEKRIQNIEQQPNQTNIFANSAPITKSQRIKTLVKLTLKKLMKKFSYEILVDKIFGLENNTKLEQQQMELGTNERTKTHLTGSIRQGLENLLINLKKLIEKEKKKRLEDEKNSKKVKSSNLDLVSIYTTNSNKTVATNINEIEDLLKESDSEDEETDAKSHKSAKTNKSDKKDKKQRKKSNQDKTGLAWLQEDENEDPLDLLDPMAIKRVLATKPLTKEEIERKKIKEQNSKSKNRGFKMSNDGKLIIDDEDEDSDLEGDKKSKLGKKSKSKKPDDLEEMMDTLSLSKKSMASKRSNKKRSIDDSDDSDIEDTKSKFSYKSGGHGIHRNLDKEKKDFGSEYRAKKARGDMKLKNKPDPYAYIPLNFSKLNKRKKAKLQGEFKGVVKAVQRGAQKGTKKMKKF